MSQKVPCNAPACYHFQKAGHPFSCQVFTAANECRAKWAQVLGIRMRGRHLPLHLCSCHFPPTHLSWNGDGWNLSLYAMPSTRLFTHTRPLISAISACAASTTTTHSGVTVPQPHSASHSLCVPLVTGTETSPALCIPIVAGEANCSCEQVFLIVLLTLFFHQERDENISALSADVVTSNRLVILTPAKSSMRGTKEETHGSVSCHRCGGRGSRFPSASVTFHRMISLSVTPASCSRPMLCR